MWTRMVPEPGACGDQAEANDVSGFYFFLSTALVASS
jgi:hypothetical protein